MTPSELKQARQSLGLSQPQMAKMLGYVGNSAKPQMYNMETGTKPIREAQRRLTQAYLSGYRPDDWPS